MSKKHSPDANTQTQLFLLRSTDRTEDLLRRSRMNKFLDEDKKHREFMEEHHNREVHKQSVKRLNNSQQTILALLRNLEAYKQTIDRLTDAWEGDKEKALDFAQEMLDRVTDELDNDLGFRSRCYAWSDMQMCSDNEIPVSKPKLRNLNSKEATDQPKRSKPLLGK